MTIQDLGAIGEFLGFFAVLLTLIYLAKQTHQNVQISRGRETRVIIDQFNAYLSKMTSPTYLIPMRRAMVSYRELDADSQAQAFVIFVQWVNFYEKMFYAHQSGLIPEPTLNAVRGWILSMLITPGGAEFWDDLKHVFGADVSSELDKFLQGGNLPPPFTETYPWMLDDVPQMSATN